MKMKRIISHLVCCVIVLSSVAQNNFITPRTHAGLRFTENKGQWESNINYKVRMSNGNIYLENNKLTYFLFDQEKLKSFHMGGIGKYNGDGNVKGHAYQTEFMNCDKPEMVATDALSNYENYFIGNDQKKWASGVSNFKRVLYSNIYSNIDVEFLTNDHQLKYNYYIKPGADASNIKLKYTGASSLKIENGKLIIETSIGDVIEEKPIALQVINSQTIQIPCVYKLIGDVVSFEISNYDKSKTLIIDPVLAFAAQSGSTADNFGMTATYDSQGNLYAGGTVFALGYPTTTGAYSNVFNGPTGGGTDVVITKYNSIGTAQLYSTYLGGNESEIVTSLVVNSNNELYLHGATGSSNFPIPSGGFDNSYNGGTSLAFIFNGTTFNTGTDIYICRFNASGTNLLGSTYMGGTDNDGVNHVNSIVNYNGYSTFACPILNVVPYALTEYKADSLQWNYGDQYRGEIQLDKTGNVYVSSSTRSSNFPTLNGFDITLGGKQDAVLFKLDPTLSNLIWSSYLGGSGNDAGYSLIVTDSSHVYATGGTFSSDFPVIPGCYSTIYNGGKADGYIVKINSAGSAILKGTYIGTNAYDQSYFVEKDNSNNIYVFGQSEGNMPVIGPVYSNPNSHQFVSKLDNQLSNMIRSTVIGSGQSTIDISPSAFSVDHCGNIYLSGWGGNITFTNQISGMPTTGNALYPSAPNGFDFYFMSLTANMSAIIYGSYFGGNCSSEHVDGGTSRFDKSGRLYQSMCAGCGGNDDFPVSINAWPNAITSFPPGPNLSSNCNNGVVKFDLQPNICSAFISNTLTGGFCPPITTTFFNASTNSTSQQWLIQPGNYTTTSINATQTFSLPGNYTISLIVTNPGSCNLTDSTSIYITIPSCTDLKQNVALMDGLFVYPNPTKGMFTLSLNSFSFDSELEIYSTLGQLILIKKINANNTELDLTKYSNGVYYLKVKSGNDQRVIKIIKE